MKNRGPVLVCLGVIFLWILNGFLLYGDSNRGTFGDMFGAINALFSGLAFVGVVYAILLQRKDLELQKTTLKMQKKASDSDEYLKGAITLLERSYEILADCDEGGRPKNKRMNWLASARFLKASQNLSSLITEDAHKRVYNEHLEYWRAKLHNLITVPSLGVLGFLPEYFAERTEDLVAHDPRRRAPLSLKSVAVLYRFAGRPDDYDDPLQGERGFTQAEIERMGVLGPAGLALLLTNLQQLKERSGAEDSSETGR